MKSTALLATALLALTSLRAPAEDKAGAKDHPVLKRYKDSVIFQYSQNAFAEYQLALGKALNPAAPASEGRKIEKEQTLEGKVTRVSYLAPAGRSGLEVFRNYEQDLKDKGFQTIFKGEKEELGYQFSMRYAGIYSQIFEYNAENNRFITAKLERPEGNVTVAIFVTEFISGLSGDLAPSKGQPVIQVDVIEDRPMENRMVAVSAEKMASSIQATGRIALYGIFFDFNKAEVKPESAPTIEQMARLLTANPALKLLVVGHTDNVGGFDYNLDLSRRRALSVVSELVNKAGISAPRLTPQGAGFMTPVATNHTEEGRAKNRRVELVEQ